MKKILLSFLLSFTLAFSASAGILFTPADEDFPPEKSFTLQPYSGVKIGKLGEYVFLKNPEQASDTGKKADNKLSYLEWELMPEYIIGLKFDSSYRDIYIGGNGEFGLPLRCGLVKDSDWLNIQYSSATQAQQAYQTNYSEHNSTLDYDYSFNIKAGYTFDLFPYLKFTPNVGYGYSKIKFTARDGQLWYGKDIATNTGSSATKTGPFSPYNGNGDSSKVSNEKMSGKALEYEREQSTLWLGFDAIYRAPQNFVVNLGLYFAPYTYTFNKDKHPQAYNKTYVDICDGYFKCYKGELGITYNLTPRLAFNLTGKASVMLETKGKSYEKNSAATSYSILTEQEGGADSLTTDITLGVKYSFY